MAMWVIPIENAAERGAWRQPADLSGVEFYLDFRWINRDGFWYFDLLDASEVPIQSGKKIVSNFALTRRITDARRPAGDIIAIDTRETEDNPAQDPGLNDLGTNIELIFVEYGTLDD